MSELYDILTETPPTKVVLLALDQGLWDCERSLAELSALCEANHMEAVAQITQKRQTPETGIVLGSGKLEEASLAAQTLGAECAVFDGELTGSQIRNISNALGGLEVIDRTMLILEIFRSRAVTNEGKLQTELALLRYRLPRLQGMGEALSRQGGGGGGGGGARRGAGETKLELDRRHVHARIDALAEKLAEMEKRRGESRKARAKTGMPVVSLVGYTNVGKSSLMNSLCGPSVAEADMLFATLDPTSRKLVLPSGMAVLLVEGSGQALAFSTQDMPGRSVTSPSGEGNMRGPQDAFTEHLRNNISQLRRQFRTGSFTAEICTANTRAKTEYAICYDTALAPADVVQTLKQRLAGVQIPVLLDSTYFASFLKQDKLNLFPAAAYTERPATACARICEGKIVILVSGSPLAMMVPSFFAEHFECLDDYSSGAVFAGLIRLLKYLAFLLAVFGPGLYVMAVSFAPELIPVHLLAKLAQGEASTPLPPMPEMLAVTLLLEIVREAGLRAPKSISHTVSLVGALIIGETAVSAGIISVPVLTMAAAATIATLAVPALYEQSILFRFAVILLAGLFGVPGLACGALLILAMACGSDPFGYDYLYPLMPPGKAALRDGFVRAIWSRLAQKGEVLPRHAKE